MRTRSLRLVASGGLLLALCAGCVPFFDPDDMTDAGAPSDAGDTDAGPEGERATIGRVLLPTDLYLGALVDVGVSFSEPLRGERAVVAQVRSPDGTVTEGSTVSVPAGTPFLLTELTAELPNVVGTHRLEVFFADRPEEVRGVDFVLSAPVTLGLRAELTEVDITAGGYAHVPLHTDRPAHRHVSLYLQSEDYWASGSIRRGETTGELVIGVRDVEVGRELVVQLEVDELDVLDPPLAPITARVVPPRAPRPGDLRFNEVMIAPLASDDVACDGAAQPDGDQFIEIFNVADDTLRLDGLAVGDAGALDAATLLEPRHALLIVSSRTPGIVQRDDYCRRFRPNALVQASLVSLPLGLAPSGPGSIVLAFEGEEIARFDWDEADLGGESWQRTEDLFHRGYPLDPIGADVFLPHRSVARGGASFSPGRGFDW